MSQNDTINSGGSSDTSNCGHPRVIGYFDGIFTEYRGTMICSYVKGVLSIDDIRFHQMFAHGAESFLAEARAKRILHSTKKSRLRDRIVNEMDPVDHDHYERVREERRPVEIFMIRRRIGYEVGNIPKARQIADSVEAKRGFKVYYALRFPGMMRSRHNVSEAVA